MVEEEGRSFFRGIIVYNDGDGQLWTAVWRRVSINRLKRNTFFGQMKRQPSGFEHSYLQQLYCWTKLLKVQQSGKYSTYQVIEGEEW